MLAAEITESSKQIYTRQKKTRKYKVVPFEIKTPTKELVTDKKLGKDI